MPCVDVTDTRRPVGIENARHATRTRGAPGVSFVATARGYGDRRRRHFGAAESRTGRSHGPFHKCFLGPFAAGHPADTVETNANRKRKPVNVSRVPVTIYVSRGPRFCYVYVDCRNALE